MRRFRIPLIVSLAACAPAADGEPPAQMESVPVVEVSTDVQSVPIGPVVVPLLGHSDGVNAVAFSPDGRLIASGSMDGTIRLWAVPDGSVVATLEGHSDWVRDLSFSPDGSRLASASHDGTLRLWDVASASEEAILSAQDRAFVSVAFASDGSTLASASWDGVVRLWNVSSRTEVRALARQDNLFYVELSPTGSLMATGTLDRAIVWDGQTGTEVANAHEGCCIQGFAFTADGTDLAIVTMDGVLVWNVASRQVTDTLQGSQGRPESVAFSADGQRMAMGAGRGWIGLWDFPARRELAVFSGQMGSAESVGYSPDGTKIVAGSWDAAVWLWDVRAALTAYERGEMPYGISNGPLPVGVARDCDQHFGPGGVIVGQVTDSVTMLPLDSAYVGGNWGCSVRTGQDGRFEISGVDPGDSMWTDASMTGYHQRVVYVSSRVGDTTRVDFHLAPKAPCDPSARPELPRVETIASEVVLRLTPDLEAALEATAPGFRPLGLDAYIPYIQDSYNLDCHQAPSAVIGDLNGDGVSDLMAHGVSQGMYVSLALVSGQGGYEVLDRGQSPRVPSMLESYLSRAEPGVYGGFGEPDPLVLTAHGVHDVYVDKASSIWFYRDGALHSFATSD